MQTHSCFILCSFSSLCAFNLFTFFAPFLPSGADNDVCRIETRNVVQRQRDAGEPGAGRHHRQPHVCTHSSHVHGQLRGACVCVRTRARVCVCARACVCVCVCVRAHRLRPRDELLLPLVRPWPHLASLQTSVGLALTLATLGRAQTAMTLRVVVLCQNWPFL
jgi:hypothetical protein